MMHQAVESEGSAIAVSHLVREERVVPAFVKRQALQRYFASIGFEADMLHLITERGAEYIGTQLYLLTNQALVSVQLYEATAEELYMRAETRHFTLGRMYSLVSKALGYVDYTQARVTAHKNKGQIQVKRLGCPELVCFRPLGMWPPKPDRP